MREEVASFSSMPELTALELKIKSPAFVRGYLGQMLGDRSDSFYQSWLDNAIRLDANCKPGKTIQCGNVCRKPENCKKGASKPDVIQSSPMAAKKKVASDKGKITSALIKGHTVTLEDEDGDRIKVTPSSAKENGTVAYKITSQSTKKTHQLSMRPDDMYNWLAKHKLVGSQERKSRKSSKVG